MLSGCLESAGADGGGSVGRELRHLRVAFVTCPAIALGSFALGCSAGDTAGAALLGMLMGLGWEKMDNWGVG